MKIENINELEIGQTFVTKKGYKMEITDIRKDFTEGEYTEQENYDLLDDESKKDFKWGMGSVEIRTYVHGNSENAKSYGWGHNTMSFKGYVRLDGKNGFLRTLEKGGWTLKKNKIKYYD